MEITKRHIGSTLELKIKGRLDGYWADHLTRELSNVIREGARHIRLNLSDVAYISSAGIRVLVQVYKQLNGIQGSFAIASPSEPVKTILEMAGLEQLLASAEAAAPAAATDEVKPVQVLDRASARFEVFEAARGAPLTCRIIGDPELLIGCRYGQEHCRSLSCPDSTFAVGLGAFGNTFEDCQGRFGELLAVGGAAAYLPPDGTNVPDYMLAAGEFVPEVKVLYALAGEGSFAKAAYFERNGPGGAVPLGDVVDACFEIAASDVIGIVMIAESAGLMGAALRRSPALEAPATAPFAHPEVRQWLSFTAERAYSRSLALVVGIAARVTHPLLAPFVRSLGREAYPAGHFHAAAFSYRPLRKGDVDLKTTVMTLFEQETLQGVLHLLNDDRELAGVGQSEFVRGACWVGPISEMSKA